jgi:hypothetical protein
MLIGSWIAIVFSTYSIFCSVLHFNQITSIQVGASEIVDIMKRTLYVLWKESVNSDGEPCHLYKQNNVLARPEPVPGFPTLCVVFLMLVTDFEVRGDFVDID